jgi:transposase
VEAIMDVIHPRCAGLDVHKDVVVACVRIADGGKVRQEVRSFGTTTTDLLALSDWLAENEITTVAMEATGVYWKPVWHVLDESFELVLANAAHIKNVPGRKTDVNDATWIADLLAHGLIRASFVPETSIQELRALTRTRKQLVRERSSHIQRIQKTLEDGNIKLSSVLTNVVGASGRAMLKAMIDGESDPRVLVKLTHPRVETPREEIVEALRGRLSKTHRFLLKLHLDQIDTLDEAIVALETEVGALLEPFRAKARALMQIPGVAETSAQVIVSEIGVDMSRFPTAAHLVSWAGLCPKNDESAGKRRSTRVRKGAPWLKTALVTAAWGAVRKKNCYLRAQFHRVKSRRGSKKAILAVAASILTAAFHILRDGVDYRDLGGDYFDRLDRAKTIARLQRRLRELGATSEAAPPGALRVTPWGDACIPQPA